MSTSAPAVGIDERVRRKQAQMIFERSGSSNLIGPPVALLMAWVLWGEVSQPLLLSWVALKLCVALIRYLLIAASRRAPAHERMVWFHRYEVALFCDGALYGLMGTALLPEIQTPLAMAMLASVVAIAAVGLVVLHCHRRAVLVFTLPVMLPAAFMQITNGGKLGLYAGIGLLVFAFLIIQEGRRAALHTLSMLRLRYEMDELAAQREQSLQQAERSNAAKGRFLATISHEVRTPLHGILGLTRMLQAGPEMSPELRQERLLTVERAGEHLLNIINDVLDHSRIESGSSMLACDRFDLARLANESVKLFSAAAADKELSLDCELLLPKPCWVSGDAARVRQVMLNLVGNAIKFTDKGWVRAQLLWTHDGQLRFEVADSGSGVAPALRDRIFEPFEQGDGSFGRKHGGTGLGLTISRQLARAMGGDVRCETDPQGGARFVAHWLMPAAPDPTAGAADPTHPAPSAEAAAPAAAAPPPILEGHVLLVEDNPVNALVAETILQRLGLIVSVVGDGHSAVTACHLQQFDAVLMDCQMPGMDGFEATRRIRQAERNSGVARVPIIALTANAMPSDRLLTASAGMDEHLAKPFAEAELAQTLRRAIAAGKSVVT